MDRQDHGQQSRGRDLAGVGRRRSRRGRMGETRECWFGCFFIYAAGMAEDTFSCVETMPALPPAVSGNVWPQGALSHNIEGLQLPGLTVWLRFKLSATRGTWKCLFYRLESFLCFSVRMIKEISAPVHECWRPLSPAPPDPGCLETELKYTRWTEQAGLHMYRTGPALDSGLFCSR